MRTKLMMAFALVVFVSLIGVVVIARYSTAGEVRAFMFPGGMASTEELVDTLTDYYRSRQSWAGVESILSLSAGGGKGYGYGASRGNGMMHGMGGMMGQRIRLADAGGKVVFDSAGVSDLTMGDDEKSRSEEIIVDGNVVGYLLLEGGMGFTRADESRLVTRLSRAAILAAVISGLFAFVLAMFLAGGLVKPVKELTTASAKLAQGDLNQRVQTKGNDEISRLGKTFNQMAESLQKAEEARKAMTADIAHELRNPLAVQRANLEALMDGVYPMTVENLTPVLEQNQLLTRLVEDLRTLALADAGQLSLEMIPTRLGEVCQRVVDSMRPHIENQTLQLSFQQSNAESEKFDWVLGDPQRLEQILGNLLSNARRFTPEGGKIEVRVFDAGSDVIVQVEDSGAGIPEEALPYVFERFYRADRSRSRSEGGSGLGLAIARQLARAHGGELEAANSPGGGAVFTLRLPKARNHQVK